ncbi:DUF1178 family protein [Qipengyuania sp. ASV99]|uniref:DUF1178 family protein n=1 Tax=Qipengyuania sp. ASV99 TaxID=3399681 RepID=UPI003A4C74AD
MIVFDLHCSDGHRFEGWFGSSSDYEAQLARGLVSCPECGTSEVSKSVMAPAVSAKGNRAVAVPTPSSRPQSEAQTVLPAGAHPIANTPMPAEVQKALKSLAKAQAKALKNSTWVGKDFAARSRAMHYGEQDQAPIHGQASLAEAKALLDEGVEVAPLPFPVAAPDELN